MAKEHLNQVIPLLMAGIMTVVLLVASSILSLFGIAPFVWLMLQLEGPAWLTIIGVIFISLLALGYVFTNFSVVGKKKR